MSAAEDDRPQRSATADVALITRGITVTASVDDSDHEVLVVRPVVDALASGVAVKAGDMVEVYWAGIAEERTLPARVSEVEGGGDDSRWRLIVTGAAKRSLRRKAVRADVALPVRFPWAGGQVAGSTQDLSEAGLRARVDGWGLPPEVGTPLTVDVTLDEGTIVRVHGEVLRLRDHAGQWVVSMRFLDLPERDEDRLRRRVFTALREQRAGTADD